MKRGKTTTYSGSSSSSISDSSSVGGADSEDRRKPPPELDLQHISEEAQKQLADILDSVPGKKDIVIQPELISLLEHITPFKFLKQYV